MLPLLVGLFETVDCHQLLRYWLKLFDVELESFEVVGLKDLAQDPSRQALLRLVAVDAEQLFLLLKVRVLHLEVLDLPVQLLGQAREELALELRLQSLDLLSRRYVPLRGRWLQLKRVRR